MVHILTEQTPNSLTCRRRHVKCDEAKPRCNGCIRNRTRCDYAKSQENTRRARPRSDTGSPILESCHGDVNEQVEEGRRQSAESASSPYLGQQMQTSETAPYNNTLTASQETNPTLGSQLNVALPHDHIVGSNAGDHTDQHISPGSTESPQTTLEPLVDYGARDLHHFESMVYGLPSPHQIPFQSMSIPFETTSDSGNSYSISLTSKWLDLLIGDATLNYGPLPEAPFDPEGTNIFGNSVVQTPITSQAGNDRLRRLEAHMEGRRVQTRNTYLSERFPLVKDRSETHVWQALEPISLQTQERVLFRHFIDQISTWVSGPLESGQFGHNQGQHCYFY